MKNRLIFLLTMVILFSGCRKASTVSLSSALASVPLYKYYYVKGILVNNLFIDTASIFYNNIHPLNSYDTCYYNDFLMQLYYDTVLIKEEPGALNGVNSYSKFLNIGNIKSINVFSNPQYNSNFDIDTPLNDIIKISGPHSLELNTYLYDQPNPKIYSLCFFFTEAPDTVQTFVFTFVWEDNQGNHFEKQTNPACLTP